MDIKNKNKEEMKDGEKLKKGFFKKIWYSIYKIEKYSELSAEGFGRAMKYLATLVIIIAIASSTVTVYRTSKEIRNIANYIDEKAPELSYSNNVLSVSSEEQPIIDTNSEFGKIIIDTNSESEEQVNQYINDIKEDENAIIILKDKIILKEIGIQGIAGYNYKELFEEMGITEFNKQDLVEYLNGNSMMPIYLNLFLVLLIYAFVIYFINTLFYIISISIVGYLASIILRLKIRYVAIFNMGIYAITLPTILNILYIGINAFLDYTISYFEVMYVLVASIYMIAAIFMIKLEYNKTQEEVQKIVEVEKEIKEKIGEQENKKQEEDKNKNKEPDKKKEKQDENNEEGGEQPEGSNA